MAKTKAKEKTVIEAIDGLAAMTKRGFDDMTERFTGRFDSVDKRLDAVEGDVKGLDRKFDAMWYELKDIKEKLENVIYRHEFENLKERVKTLEARLASGRSK